MQQYFLDQKLNINDVVSLRDDILYHLVKVLRNTNTEFRLVDNTNTVYLAKLVNNQALIFDKLNENNELDIDITVILSLFKSDKFELTLQKLTELGVKRIVPYNAKRSIVKENKKDRKLDRYKKIITEASEQSHRNIVPEILPAINLKDIAKFKSDLNFIAYEKENSSYINNIKGKSITIVIGPEGGFDEDEYYSIVDMGFKSVSLGKRILRAETAAIFFTSVIVGANQ